MLFGQGLFTQGLFCKVFCRGFFAGTVFAGAVFAGAVLAGAVLAGAVLPGAVFSGAVLPWVFGRYSLCMALLVGACFVGFFTKNYPAISEQALLINNDCFTKSCLP